MNIDWSLLERSILFRLTADEQRLLDEWLEESPEHRELHRNMQAFLADTENFRPGAERLRQFGAVYSQRLLIVSQRKRLNRIYKNIRIAALFVLPLGIALFFMLHSGQQEKTEIAQKKTEILPGNRKAILVTNEGKAVNLESTMQIVEVVGGVMVKNDTNALTYSDSVVGAGNAENRLLVPKGGEYSIQLSDGTKVWLNSASELKYPVHFTGETRKVYLKGEAYFQVAHDQQKAFIVMADNIQVKVYGTEFNINTRTAECVQTVLINGSVSVGNTDMPEQRLKPNQMAEYNRVTGQIAVTDVDVNNYIGWKSGIYIFENRTIEQIMNELSLWYDIDVFYMNNMARYQSFSGSLPRYHQINDMLSVIEKTSHIQFEIKGNTVIVK